MDVNLSTLLFDTQSRLLSSFAILTKPLLDNYTITNNVNIRVFLTEIILLVIYLMRFLHSCLTC